MSRPFAPTSNRPAANSAWRSARRRWSAPISEWPRHVEGEILRYPNAILRRVAEPIDGASPEAARLADVLADALDAHPGVGIAAPQIGASVRVILVDASRAKRPCPNHGPLSLANPRILSAEGKISFREGCLSLPDLVAHVPRAARIVVAADRIGPGGSSTTIEAEGFEAVVLQHEIDHLDGILFIDRVHRARDIRRREGTS